MKLMSLYIKSWKICASHWHYLLLLFFVNVVVSLIATNPIRQSLDKAFEFLPQTNILSDQFDFTMIMEFIREYSGVISTFISQSFAFIFIYLLIRIFLTGGIVAIANTENNTLQARDFWQACGQYFFRYFQLAFCILLCYAIIFVCLFLIFSKDGFNPFSFDNEIVLINRFWILSSLFVLCAFFIGVFRDLAKLKIFESDESNLFAALKKALKLVMSFPCLAMGFINVVGLILVLGLYIFLENIINSTSIAGIVCAQLFILFRITYKIVRLRSFYLLDEQKEQVQIHS